MDIYLLLHILLLSGSKNLGVDYLLFSIKQPGYPRTASMDVVQQMQRRSRKDDDAKTISLLTPSSQQATRLLRSDIRMLEKHELELPRKRLFDLWSDAPSCRKCQFFKRQYEKTIRQISSIYMYLYLSPGDFQYMNKSALKTRDDFILDWAFTIFHSSAIKAGINCPFTVTKKWGKNRVCKDINKSTLACRCRPSQPLDSSASLPDLTEIRAAACSFLSILSCLIFCPLVPWPACLLA